MIHSEEFPCFHSEFYPSRIFTLMAVNADAELERSAAGESAGKSGGRDGGGAAEFGDTQKLLSVVVCDGKDGLGSSSDSRRPSVKSLRSLKSLSIEQNSCRSPRSGSVASPARSPVPERSEHEPPSFMWLAVISCFCPAVPLNVIALYFSQASRSLTQANDFDGAQRLGRRSLLFSILAIATGLSIVLYLVITDVVNGRL